MLKKSSCLVSLRGNKGMKEFVRYPGPPFRYHHHGCGHVALSDCVRGFQRNVFQTAFRFKDNS